MLASDSADYTEVISALQSCFSGRKTRSMKVKVQKNFHLVRVGRLPAIWKKMSADAGIPPLPALEYQSISRHLFNYMMVEYFRAEHSGKNAVPTITILAEEENAIRYASGYVAMKKFEGKNGEKASQFMECSDFTLLPTAWLSAITVLIAPRMTSRLTEALALAIVAIQP